MLIVILPGDWEVFLLPDLTEYDTEYLKSTLFGIIECMDSEKLSAQLTNFIRKRITHYSVRQNRFLLHLPQVQFPKLDYQNAQPRTLLKI
jgi:hypothetical protein